jgi:hypothetical protein
VDPLSGSVSGALTDEDGYSYSVTFEVHYRAAASDPTDAPPGRTMVELSGVGGSLTIANTTPSRNLQLDGGLTEIVAYAVFRADRAVCKTTDDSSYTPFANGTSYCLSQVAAGGQMPRVMSPGQSLSGSLFGAGGSDYGTDRSIPDPWTVEEAQIGAQIADWEQGPDGWAIRLPGGSFVTQCPVYQDEEAFGLLVSSNLSGC